MVLNSKILYPLILDSSNSNTLTLDEIVCYPILVYWPTSLSLSVLFDTLYWCAIRHFHNKNMGGGVNLGDRAG